MRDAKLRAAAGPWKITADATIETDDTGQIRTIYVRLP
jgi:hypothetical protein